MRKRLLLLAGLVVLLAIGGGAWLLLGGDEPGTAAGIVFEDIDGDGQQGDAEPGLPGVTVVASATSPDGTSVRIETGDDGRWSSAELSGPHTVAVDAATLPIRDGAEPTQTTEPEVYELDLPAGDARSDVDFGFQWTSGDPVAGGSSSGEDAEPDPEPTTPEPTTPPPTEEAVSDECDLVGTWDLREQPFLDQITAAAGAGTEGSFSAEHLGGNYLVELRGDGSYTATRDDWSFRIGTSQGAIRVTISSVDTGTWSATEDEISIAEPAGEADVDFAIEQGGQVVPLPIPPPGTVGTDAISGSGPYTCVGDVLEVTFEGVTSTLDRTG